MTTFIKEIEDFDLEQTLECGQCFRYMKLDDGHYKVIAHGKVLEVMQKNNEIHFHHTTLEEYHDTWVHYFDLDRDYRGIKSSFEEDLVMKEAIAYKPGVRIIKQEVWECLISFIISQNKAIPHIQKIIKNISEAYGDYIGDHDGEKLYTFPTPEQLREATEQDIRDLKAGFRAPYIIDATRRVLTGELDLHGLQELTTEEAKKELLQIKGVGNKIADCVLLFSLGRHEVFPIDIWVKRVMEYFYLKEDTKLDAIQVYAKEKFGRQAGFAQQYLFYYAREKKIGK
ncbi:DNA-3-methyladenine glycosylase family protein [Vallitalea okinawensis]|uniref:DNA-3-methyladenine glycosylase family protein n=1 Tax=Vallitalea okinawensis TaxID=2078660 RepID=UPI000CFAE908|nr:DNA-3-methyladenine glycosylase [Vallitalea okinawensis]